MRENIVFIYMYTCMLIGIYRIVDLQFRTSEGTGNKREVHRQGNLLYFVSSLMLTEGIFSTSSLGSFSLISRRPGHYHFWASTFKENHSSRCICDDWWRFLFWLKLTIDDFFFMQKKKLRFTYWLPLSLLMTWELIYKIIYF